MRNDLKPICESNSGKSMQRFKISKIRIHNINKFSNK